MGIQTIIYFILFVLNFVYFTESSIVEFIVPKLIHKNKPYRIVIRSQNSGEQFPAEYFAFSFELIITLNPRSVLSIGEITSRSFTSEEYRGFSIKDPVFKQDSMEMNIYFRREAHGTIFRIRYAQAKTDGEKEAFFNKEIDKFIIYKRHIEMFLPYTITIIASPEIREVPANDREAIGHVLLPDRYGQISCQVTDGLPNAFPEFIDQKILLGAQVNIVNNDAIKLTWMVRLNDHGKVIHCRAGSDIQNITLNVYHYMTALRTSPVLGRTFTRSSDVDCIGENGYPIPKTKWTFLAGPIDASKHYKYRNDNVTLVMNMSAPLNSSWTFECQGSSYMPPVVARYLTMPQPTYPMSRTYSFIIVDPKVLTSRAGLIVFLILLFLGLTIAVVFIVINREKIMRFIDEKRQGPVQPAKIAAQKEDSGYHYKEVGKSDPRVNGTDKEDATYLEIVGTVQPKSSKALGPIHRV